MTREHHGMSFIPEGTSRKRGSSDIPPTWWDHYYRDPELGVTVFLGKSERQRRHQEHRFYSVYGEFKLIHGWIRGVEWLLECHRSARARNESVQVLEEESVRKGS